MHWLIENVKCRIFQITWDFKSESGERVKIGEEYQVQRKLVVVV